MGMKVVENADDLEESLSADSELKIIGFFGDFSAIAKETQPAFEDFCKKHADVHTFLVDVGKVKGLHKKFGVKTVPTVITVREGDVIREVSGKQSADYYERSLLPHEFMAVTSSEDGDGKKVHNVVVYTSPTCSWCTVIKNHLRKHRVMFREVDVSRDPAAAQALVRRSGQQGVPQTDIDGQIVVGFDKARINRLLDLDEAA